MNELDELMSRDPLKLSDSEVDAIVAHFRKTRQAWKIEEDKPKKAKTPTPEATELAKSLGL